MSKVKIEGHKELVRDTKNSAVINNSRMALQRAKAKKKNKQDISDRLNTLEDTMYRILTILEKGKE